MQVGDGSGCVAHPIVLSSDSDSDEGNDAADDEVSSGGFDRGEYEPLPVVEDEGCSSSSGDSSVSLSVSGDGDDDYAFGRGPSLHLGCAGAMLHSAETGRSQFAVVSATASYVRYPDDDDADEGRGRQRVTEEEQDAAGGSSSSAAARMMRDGRRQGFMGVPQSRGRLETRMEVYLLSLT